MQIKFLSIIAALLFVVACATEPTDEGQTAGSGASQAKSTESASASAVSKSPPSVSAPAPGSSEEFITIGDRVYFDLDKAEIRSPDASVLNDQAAWLKKHPGVTVVVEGHCDERGTREYNLALGDRRSNAVKEYLVSRGINADRIKTLSYGKERPAVLGSNEAAWKQNRRGVSVVKGSAS